MARQNTSRSAKLGGDGGDRQAGRCWGRVARTRTFTRILVLQYITVMAHNAIRYDIGLELDRDNAIMDCVAFKVT